ncbi:MAG: ferrous iron transport protein A [Xanthomonadaceae bacterium]|nr:ferrous iron transport protein A [Xanthomonadaceae bacterium]
MKLSELLLGQSAEIISVESSQIPKSSYERLEEMGFVVGALVKPMHRGLAGGAIAYEVRGGLIALRATEAECVEVRAV